MTLASRSNNNVLNGFDELVKHDVERNVRTTNGRMECD